MAPQTLSSQSAVPAPSAPAAVDLAVDPAVDPAVGPAVGPAVSAPSKQEDDDSRAGSMTLLLPQQASSKQPTGLPMPVLLQRPLQRPRKCALTKGRSSGYSTVSMWVLTLLAAAAVMGAVAAAAMAMAARAEISLLKGDVNRLRSRLGSHEALQNYVDRVLASGMAPVPEEDEDSVWDEPEGTTVDDLSPSYPELNEFEFPADVKSNAARHSRRHIPTVGGSYVSSENRWRPEKSAKRLKLYEALATGTFAPELERPAVPAVPAAPSVTTHYHHRSRVMEQQTRNDASWKQRNELHIQHHLQRQNNSAIASAAFPPPTPKPARLMEFSAGTPAQTAKLHHKGEARNDGHGSVVAGHFNLIDANRRSETAPPKAEHKASWCSSSWMSQHGQNRHFSVQSSPGLPSIVVRTSGLYYVYAQANPEANGLVLQRNGRRHTWCKAAPGSTCFTGSVVALDAGDSVAVRAIDGQLLNNTTASLGFIRLAC